MKLPKLFGWIPPRLRKILARLFVIFASLTVALVIVEFVLRAMHRDEVFMMPRYVTDAKYNDFEIRCNEPDAEYVHTSPDGQWSYSINSQGLRDHRVFAYEKPPSRLRVLTVGDSYTLGFEVGQGESYSAVLERYLRNEGVDAEVINAGVSGFSTAEELIYLREEGLRFQPDVVVMGFYINDLSDNLRANLFRLEDGKLEANGNRYLPAIRIRNILNSIWLYRWLSENSYLHNYMNAKATVWIRDAMASANQSEAVEETKADPTTAKTYPDELARALVQEAHRVANAAGAKFVLMNIPDPELNTSFPIEQLPAENFADHYLDMLPILKPYDGLIDLYRPRGFEHWSEFSHLQAGIALGQQVLAWFPEAAKKD